MNSKQRCLSIYIVFFVLSLIVFSKASAASYRNQNQNQPLLTTSKGLPDWLVRAQIRVESLMPNKMLQSLIKASAQNPYQLKVATESFKYAGEANRDGELSINPKLENDEAQLLRTLIHEWAHQYDFLNLPSSRFSQREDWCKTWYSATSAQKETPEDCLHLVNKNMTISKDPEFLELTGWSLSASGRGGRVSNSHKMRLLTKSKTEYLSPAEAFALNMESFLLDSSYKCRRPLLNSFLERHFQSSPFSSSSCGNEMMILNPEFKSSFNPLVKLDASRLYQVHYLLAGEGNGFDEKFGHSMLRLVFCSPERKQIGPDCLQDIQYHLVISFRASIDDVSVSYLAGLRGDYPSRLFFLPFIQVITEYNKKDLRDLFSYPLNLNSEQLQNVLKRALELHWAYDGQYYFITQNCAVETLNLLRVVSMNTPLMFDSALTPKGARDLLVRSKLINRDIEGNLDLSKQDGNFFPSHGRYVENALKELNGFASSEFNFSKEQWFSLGLEDRQKFYKSKIVSLEKSKKLRGVLSLMLLESYVQYELENKLNQELAKLEEALTKDLRFSNEKHNIQKLQESLVSLKASLVTPAQFVERGYGIPTSWDLEVLDGRLEQIAVAKQEAMRTFKIKTEQFEKLLVEYSLEQKDSKISSLLAEVKKSQDFKRQLSEDYFTSK